MPQAPPSPAVSITDTGAFTAAARNLCPTPFVLKSPPCPVTRSIFTPQNLVQFYIFLLEEDVQADLHGSQAGVEVGSHKVCQVEFVFRGADKEGTPFLKVGHMLS